MTKQKYEAAIQSLDMELYASWLPDEGEKIAEKRHELKEQYITSLEAEVARLNRALENAIEILGIEGIYRCPALHNAVKWICNDGNGCKFDGFADTESCWREYALAKAEEEK